MKCVLALSFFLAAASAGGIHGLGVVPATVGHVVSTPTASQYHAQDVLGQYSYGYDGPLSSKHESRTYDGITRGGYSYVDGHGLVQSAQYVADPANGFRVAATNLPVGPGAPAPAVHAVAAVAAPAVHAYSAYAPAVHAYSHGVPAVTSHSSVVSHDGIISHAAVGPVSHSSVVTHAGVAPLAHALAHPVAHSAIHPYALPLVHGRYRRSPGLVALGHTPAATAPLLSHGVAIASPAVHAYSAYAPAVHAYSHGIAPAAVAYSHGIAPAVAYSHAIAPAVVSGASSRYHAQDELGQYSYGYNDGVSAKEEVRTHDGVTRGAYSYLDPRGIVQSVQYAADGHGFRAAASNIV